MLNISPAPVSSAGLQFGAITRVQSASANTAAIASTTTPLNLVFGSAVTPGNLIVVAFCANLTSNTSVITDPNGSSQGYVRTNSNTTGPVAISIFYTIAQSTAGTTFAITVGTAGFNGAAVGVEYSGVKLRADGIPRSNTGNAASSTTDSLPISGSNGLIIAAFGVRGTFASEQTGWLTAITNNFSSVLQTSSSTNTANTDRAVAFCERIVSSSGSYSAAGTQSATNWSNMIASFQGD